MVGLVRSHEISAWGLVALSGTSRLFRFIESTIQLFVTAARPSELRERRPPANLLLDPAGQRAAEPEGQPLRTGHDTH